jgi:2-keto-4-pentenoate hydratase
VALGSLALEAIEATVQINGNTVATGRGDAVLGNPLNSVIWLARKLGEFGHSIRAGDLIMSGSFTRQFPIEPGDQIRVDFAGIGDVRASMRA